MLTLCIIYKLHLTLGCSQGHLLELKLAAIQALDHETFFSLFGEGKIPHFRHILDSKLSPYLSSSAYQFWRVNSNAFSSSFYRRGYSGWAIRIADWLLKMNGLSGAVEELCNAQTIEEQDRIWKGSLRKLFVEGSLVQRLVDSPVFLWNALGVCSILHPWSFNSTDMLSCFKVPQNQKKAFTDEGSVYEFIRFVAHMFLI